MVSVLMLFFTLFAVGQFSVSYCRSLLQAYETVELSDQLVEVGELADSKPAAADFGHLMELVRAAPDPGDDASEIRAIHIYYLIAAIVAWVTAPISSKAARWAESELSRCAYFAAVSLDRRLVHTSH